MMLTHLLLVAYAASTDANYFGGNIVGVSLAGKRRRLLQRARFAVATQNNSEVVIATLRGGGTNGIEPNPDYEQSTDDDDGALSEDGVEDGDSDRDDASDSSDGGEIEEDTSDDDGASSDEEGDDETTDSDDIDIPLHIKRRKHHREQFKRNKKVIKVNSSNTSKSSKSKRSINKQITTYIKENQLPFYLLLAIIAFRRDILEFLYQYRIIPTTIDANTGRRKITINWTTDVLKLILVAEVIRRCFIPPRGERDIQHVENDEKEGAERNATQSTAQPSSTPSKRRPMPPPILPLLLLLSLFFLPRNISYFILPLILRLLSGGPPDPDSPLGNLLLPMFGVGRGESSDLATRMAYLPPLEQHYAFEQLNERYYRDWGAYRKAFETHPMVGAAAASATSSASIAKGAGDAGLSGGTSASVGGMSSLVSLLANARKSPQFAPKTTTNKVTIPAAKYPSEYNNGTVIILDMTKLDTQATRMESIRDQISFLIHLVQQSDENDMVQPSGNLNMNTANITATESSNSNAQSTAAASPTVEVIVLLESPGGGVSQYGLAASHLERLRSNPNVQLTICIDTVAASGGYMMACMASPGQLYCAPFAMVGSIGVIGQSLNVQKTLKSYGVEPYVFRGGKMKNPVGMVGDVTKEGVVAMQQMIDRIHDAFREHVASAREEAFAQAIVSDAIPKPAGNYFQLGNDQGSSSTSVTIEHVMNEVATGDVFLGMQALKLGLVDRLITSDEYISERIRQGARVLKLVNYHRQGLSGLLGGPSHRGYSSTMLAASQNAGMVGVLKKLVHRLTTVLLAWAGEDGGSIPSVSARGVDDLQIH